MIDTARFKKMVYAFEQKIVVEGFVRERFSQIRTIPRKEGKLSNQSFGKMMGEFIDTQRLITLDYYGFFKRSKGLLNLIKKEDAKQVKSFFISFASIKMEDIIFLTNDVSVIMNFPSLKNEILIHRGFIKRNMGELEKGGRLGQTSPQE